MLLTDVFTLHLVAPDDWTSPTILLNLEDRSTPIPMPVEFDLSAAITKTRPPRNTSLEYIMKNALYIPELVFANLQSKETNKKRFTGFLQHACVKAGFKLVVANCQSVNNTTIVKHEFKCSSMCFYKRKSWVADSDRHRARKHKRPCQDKKDEKCSFRFTICHNIRSDCWFFEDEVDGDNEHKGHISSIKAISC